MEVGIPFTNTFISDSNHTRHITGDVSEQCFFRDHSCGSAAAVCTLAVHEVMASGIGVIAHVAVAALAGIGGVAALGTGGISNHCIVLMDVVAALNGQQHDCGAGGIGNQIVGTQLQVGGIDGHLAVFIGGRHQGAAGRGCFDLVLGKQINLVALAYQVDRGGIVGVVLAGTVDVQIKRLTLVNSLGDQGLLAEVVIGAHIAGVVIVAHGDHVAVTQFDLVTGSAPTGITQGVLIVHVVIEVIAEVPHMEECGTGSGAVDAEAGPAIFIQPALTGIGGIQIIVVDLSQPDQRVQHSDHAVGLLLGTGSLAGLTFGIAVGVVVQVLHAVGGQVKVRNGHFLQSPDDAALFYKVVALFHGEVEGHIAVRGDSFHALNGDDQVGSDIGHGVNAVFVRSDDLAVDLDHHIGGIIAVLDINGEGVVLAVLDIACAVGGVAVTGCQSHQENGGVLSIGEGEAFQHFAAVGLPEADCITGTNFLNEQIGDGHRHGNRAVGIFSGRPLLLGRIGVVEGIFHNQSLTAVDINGVGRVSNIGVAGTSGHDCVIVGNPAIDHFLFGDQHIAFHIGGDALVISSLFRNSNLDMIVLAAAADAQAVVVDNIGLKGGHCIAAEGMARAAHVLDVGRCFFICAFHCHRSGTGGHSDIDDAEHGADITGSTGFCATINQFHLNIVNLDHEASLIHRSRTLHKEACNVQTMGGHHK